MAGLVETEPSSSSSIPHSTDESPRSKQITNLTINVQTAMEWKPQALQERTNSSNTTQNFYLASHAVPSTSYTPDTSYTFGVPNPTNLPNTGGSSDGSYSGFGSTSNSYDSPLPSRTRRYFQPYSVPSTIHTPLSAASQPEPSTSSSPSLSQTRSASTATTNTVATSHTDFRFPSSSKTSSSSRRPSSSTIRAVKPNTSRRPSGDPMTRRQRRYTVAESSLSSTLSYLLPLQDQLDSAAYASQREIDGLGRAIETIDEKLKDDQARLDVLATPEGNYEEWRDERWRCMKRVEMLEAEKKSLELNLKESKGGAKRSKIIIPPQGQDVGLDQKQLRRERNLQRFLSGAASPTRKSLTFNSSPSTSRKGRHKNHASLPVARPRRMTMSDVQPMKLRPLSIEETLVQRLKGRSVNSTVTGVPIPAAEQVPAPESIDAVRASRPNHLRSPISPSSLQSPLESVVEGVEDDDDDETESGLASSISEDLPQPRLRSIPVGYPRSESIYDPSTGTVIIYRDHSDSSFDVDMDNIEVEIPSYAQDLFMHFEEERGEFDVDLGRTLATRQRPFSTPSSSPFKKSHRSPSRYGSLVGLRDISPIKSKPRSRPDSMVDSLASASPSRVSFAEGSEESKAKDKDAPIGKRLRRKLSKKIFMR
ncbi:hypothetical protein VNI00_010716 [Paramarasmius palmivorus]|uniref:Uncharacterized protein n=1 Tax=Paramarasmius palmivorus TaxID=297713 RepID=A0AAW0CEY3_9AGAR